MANQQVKREIQMALEILQKYPKFMTEYNNVAHYQNDMINVLIEFGELLAQQRQIPTDVENAILLEFPTLPEDSKIINIIEDFRKTARKYYNLAIQQTKGVDWDELEYEWAKWYRDTPDFDLTAETIFQWFRTRLQSIGGDGWVNVEDRLPTENDDCDVLILGSKFGKREIAEYQMIGWYDSEHKLWKDCAHDKPLEDNADYWFITHWQPLPSPPNQH